MTDKIMECITNPVKCKLLLEIYSQGQATAKHLSDTLGDVPQATLYRNLKKMLSDGILKVVDETPIRGTIGKYLHSIFLDLQNSFRNIVNLQTSTLKMICLVSLFHIFIYQTKN